MLELSRQEGHDIARGQRGGQDHFMEKDVGSGKHSLDFDFIAMGSQSRVSSWCAM